MPFRPVPASALPTVAVALALASPAAARPAPDPGIRLAPHRAVYDLSLLSSRGLRGVESARGRIAFDLTGNACDGYTLNFRQVTVIEGSESGSKTSDLRTGNYESGDGRIFRFRNDNAVEGGPKTSVEGSVERRGNDGPSLRLRVPKRDTATLPRDVVFPNAQMRDLIAAARAGRTLVPMRLFDGSDDGRKVYETLAVIGARIDPSPDRVVEEAAKHDALAKLPRWPVTLSYFSPGREDMAPLYRLGFELYENGVSRALRLDYGDLVLKGEMTRLELLPASGGCQR